MAITQNKMIFDDNLSSVISVSKIFDHLMYEGESPRTILNFLTMYDDKISKILLYADTSPRLFSVDFLNNCSIVETQVLAKLCSKLITEKSNAEHTKDDTKYETQSHGAEKLFWIVKVGKCFSPTIKNIFSECASKTKWFKTYKNGPNQYAGKIGNEIVVFDKLFFSAEKPYEYAAIINEMTIDELTSFSKYCEWKSLVAQRFLQEDVFACMDDIKKFVFLKHVSPCITLDYKKGLKQIVCGGLDPEIRKFVCEIIHKSGTTNLHRDESDKIMNSNSFNLAAMKLELMGDEKSCDWFIYDLLAKFGIDYIKRGAKGHRSFIEKNFNILDIVDDRKDVKSPSSDS